MSDWDIHVDPKYLMVMGRDTLDAARRLTIDASAALPATVPKPGAFGTLPGSLELQDAGLRVSETMEAAVEILGGVLDRDGDNLLRIASAYDWMDYDAKTSFAHKGP